MTSFDIVPAATAAKPTPKQWREAVAAVRSALAVLDTHAGPIDRDGVQRLKAYTYAEKQLFDIPAPDLRGLLFKLELAWLDEGDPHAEMKTNILRDARTLIGTVDLHSFDPAAWLKAWSEAGGAVIAREDQLFLGFGAPPAEMADEVRRIELQRQLIDHDGVAALLAHLRRPFEADVRS